MRTVSAIHLKRRLTRLLRKHAVAARRTMVDLDPKAIERSTIAGISLFAACSIALQGFVVAKGSFSGHSGGRRRRRPSYPRGHRLEPGRHRARISMWQALVLARRGDLQTDRLEHLGERGSAGTGSDNPGIDRNASSVPADTVIAKTVRAADVGLRITTFRPATMRHSDRNLGRRAEAALCGCRR